MIGIFNGALGEPEPWNMALDIMNTLQGAACSSPCKPIAAMDALNASQQAYRVSIALAGADININYFLCITM